jgi:hypothetical protein
MSLIAKAVTILALASVLVVGPAAAANLPSEWAGAYGYEDGRQAVPFFITLASNGNIITGHIDEVQTFGVKSADDKLGAKIVGSLNGHQVVFTKTYDGKGGQTHSVTYKGTLLLGEDGAQCMLGTWRLGADIGPWMACPAR